MLPETRLALNAVGRWNVSVSTLLFCQHGWSDTHHTMERLGRAVAEPGYQVIAIELGYIATWLGTANLVDKVERECSAWLERYPDANARVLGHSMGGLLWLEVLDRHPEWWPRFDRLVLLGAPIGGADLAIAAQPLNLAVARDLAIDRRSLADRIASAIPTLSIVGDLLPGTDGLVTRESARCAGARLVTVFGTTHMALRSSRVVQQLIRAFFQSASPPSVPVDAITRRFEQMDALARCDPRLARLAPPVIVFADGTSVRYLKTFPGLGQLFLVGPEGECRLACRPKAHVDVDSVLEELRETHADALA
jgi:pimeloyl-ACP methyl ester carboxylesterase